MKKIISSFIFFCLFFLLIDNISAQTGIAKSWEGSLNVSGTMLKLVFHIASDADGKLSGTLDSPDQGAKGIPASAVSFDSGKIKFEVASIGGIYEGKVNEDFSRIKGEWRQAGNTFPLALTPSDSTKKEEKKDFIGIWQGTLKAGATNLSIVARFFKNSDGTLGAFLDSPDQGVKDLPAVKTHYGDDSVYFEITMVRRLYW